MKKIILFLSFFSPVLLVGAEVPPRPTSYVTDQAGILDAGNRLRLEGMLVELNQKTSAEVAVVTVKGLGDREINELATDIFNSWGIGKKGKDNGVLFLIAPQDRKMRIEVGYGLEGILPDGLVGRIMDEVVLPQFKQNQYANGVLAGSIVLAQTIAKDAGVTLTREIPQAQRARGAGTEPSLAQKLIFLLFIILMIPIVIRHPWLLFFLLSGGRGGGYGGGMGGGFGGFGGGMSGGGGAGRSW